MHKWKFGIILVIGIILALVYYFPILNSGANLGIQDWDQNFAWTELTRVSMLEYHQFPLWNPYKCGGSVQFANPQIPVISLQTLFAFLLGTVRGIKMGIFFHGVIGFFGMLLLGRHLKVSLPGSILAAVLFSFSGITASYLSTGMVVFTSIAYSPYIFLCYLMGTSKRKWSVVAGVVFAISFYAGYHISLLLGILLVIYTLVDSLVRRNFSAIFSFAIMVLVASVLVLPKLLFSYQLLQIYPRGKLDVSGFSLRNILYFLISRKQNLFNEMSVSGYYEGVDENSLYVGALSLFFFAVFFIRNKVGLRRNLVLLIVALFILWLMFGSLVTPSLYKTLQPLPVFSSFRVAQRYRFDFIMPFALIAGMGWDHALHLLRYNRWAKLVLVLFTVVIFVDLSHFSSKNFLSRTLILVNPETQLSPEELFIQTEANRLDFELQRTVEIPENFLDEANFRAWSYEYLQLRQNIGVINCYDSITSGKHALGIGNPAYQGEYYLSSSEDKLTVDNSYWSPNRLEYQLSAQAPPGGIRLIVNQNFYPGWIGFHMDGSCERLSQVDGLLSIQVRPGEDEVDLEFNPLRYYLACR